MVTNSKALTGELMPKSEQPKKQNKGWANLKPRRAGDPTSGGRQKGSQNKVTREVKDVIARCFDAIGGEAQFAKWASRNQDEFYKIYAKLLPIKLQADMTKSINIYVTREDTKLL